MAEERPNILIERNEVIEILVRTMIGEYIPLSVEVTSTVDDVKIMLYQVTGVFPDQQVLVFLGDELEDGRTLKSYRIQESSELSLMPRINAGFQPTPL
ncbi:ubiquitin [Eurytemora carolleeae]|uniref:ubiquitin n=1 Tax=Eurytemora carolleeae TaxID=1294199 RepID=UPI000C75CDFB|nr:ubiquitin [Eurytemora carolleeae]|eukprot:XP_023329503.1 ubiquitin-like [Eurytemora affinis]